MKLKNGKYRKRQSQCTVQSVPKQPTRKQNKWNNYSNSTSTKKTSIFTEKRQKTKIKQQLYYIFDIRFRKRFDSGKLLHPPCKKITKLNIKLKMEGGPENIKHKRYSWKVTRSHLRSDRDSKHRAKGYEHSDTTTIRSPTSGSSPPQ